MAKKLPSFDRLMNSFVRREDLMSEFTVVRNEFESGENNPYMNFVAIRSEDKDAPGSPC